MKERASAPGGCWKVQSIRLHQAREAHDDHLRVLPRPGDLAPQRGRKLETVRLTNSPAALRREIARAGKNPKVVIEATYGWYWAVDVLEAAGAEVHLAHPLGVRAFSYRRVKNDEKDAADLADLLRLGRLPEAWIAPP